MKVVLRLYEGSMKAVSRLYQGFNRAPIRHGPAEALAEAKLS
jgi:hypothetical protein